MSPYLIMQRITADGPSTRGVFIHPEDFDVDSDDFSSFMPAYISMLKYISENEDSEVEMNNYPMKLVLHSDRAPFPPFVGRIRPEVRIYRYVERPNGKYYLSVYHTSIHGKIHPYRPAKKHRIKKGV